MTKFTLTPNQQHRVVVLRWHGYAVNAIAAKLEVKPCDLEAWLCTNDARRQIWDYADMMKARSNVVGKEV